MKKIIFVLPLLAMMVVGCSNPTNTETPEEKKTVQTPVETPQEPETPSEPEIPTEPEVPETPVEPEEPETPVQPEQPQQPETPQEPEEPVVQEDKSPYEYVLPTGVSYNDYTYVGDYIFSDLVNFTQCDWFNNTEFSTYNYFMVLKKKARVQYTGNGTPYELYDWDTDTYPTLNKGTRYEIYLKKTYLDDKKNGLIDRFGSIVFSMAAGSGKARIADGNTFIVTTNTDYTIFNIVGGVNLNDYSTIQ